MMGELWVGWDLNGIGGNQISLIYGLKANWNFIRLKQGRVVKIGIKKIGKIKAKGIQIAYNRWPTCGQQKWATKNL